MFEYKGRYSSLDGYKVQYSWPVVIATCAYVCMGVGVCLSVYVCLLWIPAHWSGNHRVPETHRGCTGEAQCWRLARHCARVWGAKHENVSKKYYDSWAQEPYTARRPVTLPLPLQFSTDQCVAVCVAVCYSVERPSAILWGDNHDCRSLQRWRLFCKRGNFYDSRRNLEGLRIVTVANP